MIKNRSKKKIVLITANHLRHKFIKNSLNKTKELEIVLAIEEHHPKIPLNAKSSKMQIDHFKLRDKYEKFFFKKNYKNILKKFKTIKTGQINKNEEIIDRIKFIKPDVIICFGCSILKKEIVNKFKNKILNIHLGLSPYYRGQGTNLWAFVNNELQCIGATFHLIDHGVDTGPIIHQIRARIYKNDNIHQIGNRLIKDLPKKLFKIIKNFESLECIKKKKYKNEKFYKGSDFDDESIKKNEH